MTDEVLGGLLPYQQRWVEDGSRFKIGLWARQTGKDFASAAEAVLDCVARAKSHWVILACGERQARESLEKAREWARALEGREAECLRYMGVGCGEGSCAQIRNEELGIENCGEVASVRRTGLSALRGETFEESWPEGAKRYGMGGRMGRTPHVVPYNGRLVKRESATEIWFTNGSRITALPAKAGTVRGYSANLILTEFAFHDDAEGIWRAIFPSVSNPLRGGPKKVRIISTPNGQGNFFHELWTGSKIFERHRVTIHEAKEQGLPMDVAALREGLADAEAWAQEYECEFVDQSAVLLPYELIEGCEAAEATETSALDQLSRSWEANVHHAPELYVGIDFGRKQDLTVCWVIERVGARLVEGYRLNVEGLGSAGLGRCAGNDSSMGSGLVRPSPTKAKDCFVTREVLVMRGCPTPRQIEALLPRVRLARRVCVDYTGAGIGLGDALAQECGAARDAKDWSGKVELCTFTAGLKEEIFVKLRAAFERRSVWIPKSSEIREDLHSLHRVVSPSGHISFRASRTADGHSDRCTALALAVRAAESAPRSQGATSVGRRYAMWRRR